MARPHLLVIAGLDPSGGAGLLADVRLGEQLGARVVGVATALTEQDSHGARAANPVSAEVVRDQLRALLSDVEVAAVKIGMLGDAAIAEAVGEALALTAAPVVWDPVLRPTRGPALLYAGDPRRAVDALRPHLTLITPNLDEAALLLGAELHDHAAQRAAARAVADAIGAAALIKGGHFGGPEAIDVLAMGCELHDLRGPRIATSDAVHGTGCALSTAIAVGLAHGRPLLEAVRAGKQLVAERLADPVAVGRGRRSIS